MEVNGVDFTAMDHKEVWNITVLNIGLAGNDGTHCHVLQLLAVDRLALL